MPSHVPVLLLPNLALILWALEDRPDPWTKVHEPADPVLLRRTRQFIDYAARRAAEH